MGMLRSSRNLLPISLLLLLTLSLLSHSSSSSSFDFPSFSSLRNLTLLGDSYLREPLIGLTRQLNVPSSSSGTLIYNDPLQFTLQNTPFSANFSTHFTFSVNNVNPASFGDGLTFFLSPSDRTLGSPGGYLGLVNATQLTKNRFLAVEFDTRADLHFNDPNDNHVGLDIDSLESVRTADLGSVGVDLKSGNVINVWIDYKNGENLCSLEVFLSYSGFKPGDPVLRVDDVNLGEYLKGVMYVGFSGSTGGSTETHSVQNWSFQFFGDQDNRPWFSPHNVSDNSVFVRPPNVNDSNGKRNRQLGLGLGIAGPAFFCVFLVVFGWISVKKWRGIRIEKNLKAELVTGPRKFGFKEVKAATNGFHSSRIVGHGAFGTVYKAFFSSTGGVSAVKRSRHSQEGKTEFVAELSIIASLRHKNLVQLQGWCVEKGELLLVYEFMPNGSLDNVLYQESEVWNHNPLKWAHRYNIARGLASVLTYLHQECEQQVIHRDVKTSNIMLDVNYNARLGDFGLARLMDHDKSPVSTLTAGTMGYLAPEYLQYGKATEKTDVFSYGVVILELACGRRPIEKEPYGQRMVNLVDWVWALHSKGKIIEAMDKRLDGEFVVAQAMKLLLVGLSCANPDSTARPTMRRVFQILNGEAEPMLVPRLKPTLSFSSYRLSSLEDIFSDGEESRTPERMIEIKFH